MATSCTAFFGPHRIASGDLDSITTSIQSSRKRAEWPQVLIFEDATGDRVEVDWRTASVKLIPADDRKPGRPKLGVVAREVTLLPRHWEWLATQPGGASVALRKLVEHARRANEGRDRLRRAQEAAYRFISTMAGNAPGFEEASRALFAGDARRFESQSKSWPADVRDYARQLARAVFDAVEE